MTSSATTGRETRTGLEATRATSDSTHREDDSTPAGVEAAPAGVEAALCPPQSGPPDMPVGAAADEALAELAKAVGHPVRARIVRLLASQESCQYGDLTDRLPLAKSTVSQHLKVLREAGLVRGDVDGPRVCYCIDPTGLQRLKGLVAAL